MVQPLNKSTCKVNFIANTVNNHPELHNTPLWLTNQESNNPVPVLQEFFRCYHFNDVGEIMWGCTVTILSSPDIGKPARP